jgi:hypothetical protein
MSDNIIEVGMVSDVVVSIDSDANTVDISLNEPSNITVELFGVREVEGPPGDEGLSAYEVAVVEGFIGTEAEWLISLEGAAGAPGADGEMTEANTIALIIALGG